MAKVMFSPISKNWQRVINCQYANIFSGDLTPSERLQVAKDILSGDFDTLRVKAVVESRRWSRLFKR